MLRVLRFRWLLTAIVLAAICAIVFRGSLLRLAGSALVAEDPLAPADVVVVPQWAGTAGALEAVDLVKEGHAKRVAVLLAPSDAAQAELTRRGIHVESFQNWLMRVIAALGVPVQNIPATANGTGAEGDLLHAWCRSNGIRSIIVVSSTDHSRRVRRVLRRTMTRQGIDVIVREARYSEFDPESWWMSRGGVRTEIVELEKLVLDLARHPFD
jgi:uncharacterized SAM-binding protein YcdF (DUF218 family)